jgi:hypothetical protein
MKALRNLLALAPVALLASSSLPHHQAFGPLRFGTSEKEAEEIFRHIHHGKDPHAMTAAEARLLFVTSGGLRLSRTEEIDRVLPVYVWFHANPMVDQISVQSVPVKSAEYNSVKKAWEDFQDLGDCKFQRKSEKSPFPQIEAVDSEPLEPISKTKSVVTDTWEIEGIRIQLVVQYVDPAATTFAIVPPMYRAALIATEITPQK